MTTSKGMAAVFLASTLAGSGAANATIDAADAMSKVRFRIDTAGVWQALEHTNDTKTLRPLRTGFQAAQGNLHIFADIAEGVDLYAELYLSSQHHRGDVMDREGYVLIRRLPDELDSLGINRVLEYVDVKAGHFEVDFGDQHLVRSDSAQVTANPLIGNYVIDPNTVESGVEVIGRYGPIRTVAGITNGVTTEDFMSGRDYARYGKVRISPAGGLASVAGSLYRVDHSGNSASFGAGSKNNLFAGNRSGSRYAGVIDFSADAGTPNLTAGQDIRAWQVDAAVTVWRTRLSGLLGHVADTDINGTNAATAPEDRWTYYGGEAKVDLVGGLYGAARYSGARSSKNMGAESSGHVDRYQCGLGLKVTESVLLKGEYVDQRYTGLIKDDPRFRGVLLEMAVAFGG